MSTKTTTAAVKKPTAASVVKKNAVKKEAVVTKAETKPKKAIANATPVKKTETKKAAAKPAAKKAVAKPVVKKTKAKVIALPNPPEKKPIKSKLTKALEEAQNKQPEPQVQLVQGQAIAPDPVPKEILVPLIPFNRQDSDSLNAFTNQFETPIPIDGVMVPISTGMLQMNRTLNLLKLSENPDWIEKRIISTQDVIDSTVQLTALHINVAGQDRFLQLAGFEHPFIEMEDPAMSNVRRIQTTAVYRFTHLDGKPRVTAMFIEGTIELNTGTVFLTGKSTSSDISVLGYYLSSNRKVKVA